MSSIISENALRNIQLISIIFLMGGAIGLVGSGVFIYGYDSDYTKELCVTGVISVSKDSVISPKAGISIV